MVKKIIGPAIMAALFMLIAVHAVFAQVTSSHCNNYQNRSCSAAVWKVWEW